MTNWNWLVSSALAAGFFFSMSTTAVAFPVSVCGNGVVEAGETCDNGVGGMIPSDLCCDATCHYKAIATPCDLPDSDCSNESCDATGGCFLASYVAEGTACSANDDNPCTQDVCDGGGECANEEYPTPTCADAEKVKLSLTSSAKPGKDKVKFGWKNGAIVPADLAGVIAGTDALVLCVYDLHGLISQSTLLPTSDWVSKTKGDKTKETYTDKDGVSQGVTSVGITFGGSESALSLKAGGPNLTGMSMIAPLTQPATVQMRSSDGGCWGAQFLPDEVKKNDGKKFKAVAK